MIVAFGFDKDTARPNEKTPISGRVEGSNIIFDKPPSFRYFQVSKEAMNLALASTGFCVIEIQRNGAC